MANIPTGCQTEGCGHKASDHGDGKRRRCSVPGCPCDDYWIEPTEAQRASWQKAAETKAAKKRGGR